MTMLQLTPELREALQERVEILAAIDKKRRTNRLADYRPYAKQKEFHDAGALHRERLFLAGNQLGKSFCGGAEAAIHLTGRYPEWWQGKRWDRPVRGWAGSNTSETTRDNPQRILVGEPKIRDNWGTAAIPGSAIVRTTSRMGVADALDSVVIKHVSGGESTLGFKCFAAGTRVKMADGTLRPIEFVNLGDWVLCADGASRQVTETHSYADAPLLEIITRSGKITVTPNHRMFTARGEIEAGALSVGDVLEIAAPILPCYVAQEDWRVKLTALMIGDGCTRGKTPFFTCNEPDFVREVEASLPPLLHLVPVNGTISYKISSSEHKRNCLKDSLVSDGLWGKTAHHKFIPDWVFKLPPEQKLVFLRWLWGCDGHLTEKDATYASSSLRLIQDVRLLLWDLGIHADYRSHYSENGSSNHKKFLSHYLGLHGENRIRFQAIGKLNRDVQCNLIPRPKGPYGEIIGITELPPANVFCVTVADAHELIAEGFRVGNSYDQGRQKWQGETLDFLWCDEEPPIDIYMEGLTRTNATNGIIWLTLTPLLGMSEVVRMFLDADRKG